MSFYATPLRFASFTLLTLVTAASIAGCDEQEVSTETQLSTILQQEPSTSEPHAPATPDHLAKPPKDPRAALVSAFDSGLLNDAMSINEKLSRILQVAGVPEASQVLVFSKTSLQHRLISPSNPRAIYFSDNCYIGYVPGGLIEYGDADPDPAIGSGMFAIDPHQEEKASFKTDHSCLSCHEGARTNGRPGFFIRSVYPDPEGHVITSAGSTNVSHDTPLDKRWGGWYVTGHSGSTHHRGNQVTIEHPSGDAHIDNSLGSNLTDLSHRFNTARYLQPTSDIVALMVLEHQVQMHNLLTQASSVVHEQYERSRSLAAYLEEPFDPSKNETIQRVIQSNTGRIVEHLLYCDEISLTEPIKGSDLFIQQFRANRKPDSLGRSLKDFDLNTRMFKYRCSYMVYSRAFELMPDMLKVAVSEKLRAVLLGQDNDSAYDHLTRDEKQAIYTILTQTGIL